MFLSNTLALFRAPLHVPPAASPASSSTTNSPQPSIHRCASFPDSHSPRPLTSPAPPPRAAVQKKKQLVPKVIARCSPTPTPTPPPPQSTSTSTSTTTTTTTTTTATKKLTRPPAGRRGIQLIPGTRLHEQEDVRKRYPWNPVFFPAPPQKTPTIIIMLMEDSSRRRAASTPSPITPQHSPKTPTKKSVLSYFASPAGQKFLDNLELETKLKKKEKNSSRPSRPDCGRSATSTSAGTDGDRATHERSLENEGIGRKSRGARDVEILNGGSPPKESQEELARDRGHVGCAGTGHVATNVWSDHGYSQSPERHHIRAAAAGISRETKGDSADVFDGVDTDTPVRSTLSRRAQLDSGSFDHLLRDIKHDQKTNEMGLGRLEFGGTFRLFPSAGPVKKAPSKKPAAQAPGHVQPTVSEHGIIPQPLPPRSQVVLITDGSQSPADINQRGMPSGSSVVLIIDQQWDVRFHDPTAAAIGPEAVASPPKLKRRNHLRDVVRLRWSVFHPDYTEKSEFTFQRTQLARPEPKRKLSAAMVEQKPKRTRDGDVEGPFFNEKQRVATEVAVEEPIAGSSVLPVAIEESTPTDLDCESIQQHPTPPSEVEPEPSEVELEPSRPESSKDDAPEFEEAAISEEGIVQPQLPPPVSRVMSPIPLEWDVEEEAAIKVAIKEAMGEQNVSGEDSDAEFLAMDLSTLPPLPESPVIEAVQVEEVGIDFSTLPALPDSPLVEAAEVEVLGEAAPVNLQLGDNTDPPPQMTQQPSPPPSEPNTPTMTPETDEAMKMVPWMPLTPPETPLSMRHGRERVIEFNVAIPLFPPTPSSVLDSPVFFRGKDRQTEDSPSHYFTPAPPSPSSPSHSILDSPLATRMRRIGETIKEEEDEDREGEQEEEEEGVPTVPAENEEDEESDVEEIIRSPQFSYPSPPSSPMPTAVVNSPKGKELARVPSFTIIYTPSPPPSVLDIHDTNEDLKPPSSPEPKGKEKELLSEKPSIPSPVLEQDEEQDLADEDFIRRTPWATADDIFTNPDSYHYTYTYNSRPPTPASSVGTLSRRWSRASYSTALTTPPATRPGSAAGSHHKLLLHDDHLLRRTDSFASSIRRELQARRKPLIATPERPALRWSISMPLIREQWPIRQPTVVSPAEKNFVGAKEEYEEYDVHVPGSIQLLPVTRGVIVTPPRIERRRRQRSTAEAGPHRRKVKTLVVYSPDEQLEGLGGLFGELREVEDEIATAERIVGVVEVFGEKEGVSEAVVKETLKEQEGVVEVLKEKKKGLLKRMKTRASTIKDKVKTRVSSKGKTAVAV